MYHLRITAREAQTIDHVGGRYEWSDALIGAGLNLEDEHDIPEFVAWNLADAFEADTEGGHLPFPMLDPNSTLYEKLSNLWDRII